MSLLAGRANGGFPAVLRLWREVDALPMLWSDTGEPEATELPAAGVLPHEGDAFVGGARP